jgi:hypothetical protein
MLHSLLFTLILVYPSEAWELKFGNSGEGNYYQDGMSVGISSNGEIIAIGVPGYDYNGANAVGQVRIFEYTDKYNVYYPNYYNIGDIIGENSNDQFGYGLALSADGTRVAVAAPFYSSGSGRIRVFGRDTSTSSWVQLGSSIDGDITNGYPGYDKALSLSGDGTILAVGNNNINPGTVRVYTWDSTSSNWFQLGATLQGTGPKSVVDLSCAGTRLAVGYPNHNSSRGIVSVFDWNADTLTWEQIGSSIDGEEEGDISGTAISMSCDGKKVAIGAPSQLSDKQGNVRIFIFNDELSSWVPLGSSIYGQNTGDKCGSAVSLSDDGTRIAVSSPYFDTTYANGNPAPDVGQVRVFEFESISSEWLQVGSSMLGNYGTDKTGTSIGLSGVGYHVIIGAPYDTTNQGSFGGEKGETLVYTDIPITLSPTRIPTWFPTASPTWFPTSSRPSASPIALTTSSSSSSSVDKTTIVAGSVTAAVVVCVVIILLIVYFFRRQSKQQEVDEKNSISINPINHRGAV